MRFLAFFILLVGGIAQPLFFAASDVMAQNANGTIEREDSQSSPLLAPGKEGMSAANLERRKNSTITIPIFSGGQSGINSTGKAPEKIRFVAADDFPPFVFRDSEQRLMGYNIDLAREICQNLKVACSLEIKPFGHLANTVVNGEADAVIAGLTITPDTLNLLQFSRIYMRFPGRFVTAKNNSLNPLPDTMGGKKIAVVIGSRHEAFLERFFQNAIPIPFDNEELARKAIISSDVDALFGDGMRLSFWLDTKAAESCCQFAGGPWLDPGYFGGGLAIATKAGNTKTLNAIDLGLSRLQANGRLGELYLRYFPRGFF